MSTLPPTDTGASAYIPGYLEAGFKLIPIPLGKKGPTRAGWNLETNCHVPASWTGNLGLALAYCMLATIDVDAYTPAKGWLADRGIDLDALLASSSAVQISSGKEGHCKLIYKLPFYADVMTTKKIQVDGQTALEFRSSTKNGLTSQDLLPPSIHPDTKRPYEWKGDWRNIPQIPIELLQVWIDLENETKLASPGADQNVSSKTEPRGAASTSGSNASRAEIESALKFLNPDLPRDQWIQVGMALHQYDPDAIDLFDRWSREGTKYIGTDIAPVWKSFNSTDGGIGIGTLFKMAKEAGWQGYRSPEYEQFYTSLNPSVEVTAQGDNWSEIIPLPERGDVGEAQPYQLDLLPAGIQKAAGEVARFSMVPKASPAVIGLSVLAAALGKKAVIVERKGLEHYPALFFTLIAHSGERKSPAFKTMTYPLDQWAEDQQADYEDRTRNAKARNAAVDNEISTVKGKAKKAGSGIDLVTDELSRLEAERIQPPPFPSLFTTDTTEQRLFQKMHDRGGAYAVMSGEGRPVLDAIMGKYSGDGRTGDAVYLAGISGDTITRDRVGGDNGPEERVITRPCLNVCVMVQQGKYMEAASVSALRDSGALARIWPVWMQSMAGTRIEQEGDEGLNTELLTPFNRMVRDVLEHEAQTDEQGRTLPHKAHLSPEAIKARREFHNDIERLMAEGGELEDVRDIASKTVSQTCKLALVLHIAENHSVLNTPESTISAKIWEVAQTLGKYHLQEAVRVQRLADEDSTLESARRVLRWIQREGLVEVTGRAIMREGPRPRLKAPDAARVLEMLEDHGFLRPQCIEGKRKPVYQVHPNVAIVANVAGGNGEK